MRAGIKMTHLIAREVSFQESQLPYSLYLRDQELVLLESHGQTKLMDWISHIDLLSVRMLAYVIAPQAHAAASLDSLEMRVREVIYPLIFLDLLFSALPFTGECPNNCNGKGLCLSLRDVSVFKGRDYDSTLHSSGDGIGPIYSNWERKSLSTCYCDPGFFGPDCSQGPPLPLPPSPLSSLTTLQLCVPKVMIPSPAIKINTHSNYLSTLSAQLTLSLVISFFISKMTTSLSQSTLT